ncbi:MAG: carboxypeptidase regulatory-like domain-containing protein [Gemmatimonadetes bacterium]|nr:carboxypeptidase regulatory-like domain-containing protein [Gemmatimonadota bacterium]
MRMCISLFAMWLTLGAAAAGQTVSTGAVLVRVVGPDSVGIGGVMVVVSRQAVGFSRQSMTDPTGVARVGFLPPGIYQVAARRIGYRPAVVGSVPVSASAVTSVGLRLTPTQQTLDSLVVEAPAVTVDLERTEFGTTISSRELRLLPTPNDARNLVGFANGARPDQVFGGATAQANNYQLDGVAVNHPGIGGDLVQPSVTWIEEVQVRGLGAGAETEPKIWPHFWAPSPESERISRVCSPSRVSVGAPASVDGVAVTG